MTRMTRTRSEPREDLTTRSRRIGLSCSTASGRVVIPSKARNLLSESREHTLYRETKIPRVRSE